MCGLLALVRDPVAELEKLQPKRNPIIPLPNAIFGKGRLNSAGVDLSDPLVREPLLKKLAKLESKAWRATPTGGGSGEEVSVLSPFDTSVEIGKAGTEAARLIVDAPTGTYIVT